MAGGEATRGDVVLVVAFFFAFRRAVGFFAVALAGGLGFAIAERVEPDPRRLGAVVPRTATFFPAALVRLTRAVDVFDFVAADGALRATFFLDVVDLERVFVPVRLATGIAHPYESRDQRKPFSK